MHPKVKRIINIFLDIFLFILGLLVLIAMARQIYSIFHLVIQPLEEQVIARVIGEVLIFLMLFEFIILIFRYIQEGHHIPLRYLIYICITAILRQILSVHGPAKEVFFYAISIFVLVCTLILTHNAMMKIRGKKSKDTEEKEVLKNEMKDLMGRDKEFHG